MSQSSLEGDDVAREFARQIAARGLGPIALLTLEAGRPLALLAAQFMWLAQPMLAVAWPDGKLARWAHYFEQPGSVDVLIDYLEADE